MTRILIFKSERQSEAGGGWQIVLTRSCMKKLGIALLAVNIHRGKQIKVKPDWNGCKRASKHLQAACAQEVRARCFAGEAGPGGEGQVSRVPACECAAGGAQSSPSLCNFFCFMRLFWNQTFTCVSLSCRALATSTRLARVRYLLKWNSFSSSVSCLVLKLVLGAPFTVGWPSVQMLLLLLLLLLPAASTAAPRPDPTILNPQVMGILAGKRGAENSRQEDQWGRTQKQHKTLLNKIIHAHIQEILTRRKKNLIY